MTVNKFGNYLYHKTHPKNLRMTTPVLDINLLYKSICVVSLTGTSRMDTLRYVLENGLNYYEFKISVKTKHLEVSTNCFIIIK